MRLRKNFAHHHLILTIRRRQPPPPQEKLVELLGPVVRDGNDGPVCGLHHAWQIQSKPPRDPCFHYAHAGNLHQTAAQGIGGPLQIRESIGKPVFRIISIAGGFQRKDQTAGHDHHRQPARHDQANREYLPLHPFDIAEQFEIKRGQAHGYQARVRTSQRWALEWILVIKPSDR